MSEYNEKISALMDDEGNDSDVHILNRLPHSPGMRGTWLRYHLIGDCLRRSLPKRTCQDISSNVHNALRSKSSVLTQNKKHRLNLKPFAGFAIAASVALVSVLLGLQTSNNKKQATPPSLPTVDPMSVAVTTMPQTYDFNDIEISETGVEESNTPQSTVNQRMNRYLLSYDEYRSNIGMNVISPYVRIVTIESRE